MNKRNINSISSNTSAIEGIVWTDANGDGLRNGQEKGIAGVSIELIDTFGNVISSVVSSTSGSYNIRNLPSGAYKIRFPRINNHYFTKENVQGGPDQDSDATNDSDANLVTGESFIIYLQENHVVRFIYAGYFQTGIIQGEIWYDADLDGIKENNENKIKGIIVNLEDENGNPVHDALGNPIDSIISDQNGSFQFSNLIPNYYRVVWDEGYSCFFTTANKTNRSNDNNDIEYDSDAENGKSHIIFVTSNRIVQGIDAGIKYLPSISGRTFYDFNKNQIVDSLEFFAPDFRLELWQVKENAQCPGDSMNFIAYLKSNNGFQYYINKVLPGQYYIRLDSSQFGSGGDFEGLLPSTEIKFCVELNCNLPSVEFEIGFYHDCIEPKPWDQWPSCQIASEKVAICDLRQLEINCQTMFVEKSKESYPFSLCTSGGAPHNTSWIPFIAGYGQFEIQVFPENCMMGGGGQLGIQGGIYTDCSFTNEIYCVSDCTTEKLSMPSTSLVPGQKYYLFIDGCSNSVCAYRFNISGNYTPFEIPDSSLLQLQTSNDTFCPNQLVTFSLSGLDLTLDYTWSVFDGIGLTPELDYPVGWPKSNNNQMTLSFPNTGTYTVCMVQATNSCEQRGPFCKQVIIENKYELGFVYTDTLISMGGPFNSLIELPNDSLSTIFIKPIYNAHIINMKPDTILNGGGYLYQNLFNLTEVNQVAKYLIFKDSIRLPECTAADTISVTVLPMKSIIESQYRLCPDSCITLIATLPDSVTTWKNYWWNTGDTSRQITLCPAKDTVVQVFVQDPNNLYYKLQFELIPEDIDMDFNLTRQPACADSLLEINYMAISNNFPGEDFLYFIFDCSQSLPIHLFSADTSGSISIPLTTFEDTLCFRLDVLSANCQYSTYLSMPNPKSIIGEPCDDGNVLTENDAYDETCVCRGEIINAIAGESEYQTTIIYPNPTTGLVYVNTDIHHRNCFIYNSLGSIITPAIENTEKGFVIDFSDFPSGIYTLGLLNNPQATFVRIIKF